MLQIENYFQELTPAAIDRMAQGILDGVGECEAEIQIAEDAANALESVRHYKAVDNRLANHVMATCSYIKAGVRYDKLHGGPNYGKTANIWTFWTYQNHVGRRYACVYITLLEPHTVGDLIDALRAATDSRTRLERLKAQFTRMEDLLDAEEHIRKLVFEIEETQRRMRTELFGDQWQGYHEEVSKTLPALSGHRR